MRKAVKLVKIELKVPNLCAPSHFIKLSSGLMFLTPGLRLLKIKLVKLSACVQAVLSLTAGE